MTRREWYKLIAGLIFPKYLLLLAHYTKLFVDITSISIQLSNDIITITAPLYVGGG